MLKLVLSNDCPSSKNSRNIVHVKRIIYDSITKRKTEKIVPQVIKSKYCQKWERMAVIELKNFMVKQREAIMKFRNEVKYPFFLLFYFYRNTMRSFDYNNMTQEIQDLIVNMGIIPDDSVNYVIPICCGWEKDEHNPRTEIVFAMDYDKIILIPEEWKNKRIHSLNVI